MARKKKYFIWIVIIAIIAGGFFYLRSKKPKTTYTTQDVKRGILAQTVSVTGKLVSETQVDLSFRTGGEIAQIHVKVGDKISKGQKVAEISRDLLNQQIAAADKDIIYQKRILDDMRLNKKTYDGKRREAQVALVQKAQVLRREIITQFADTIMTAPMDGVVIAKHAEVGENVAPNASVLTIAIPEKLEIQSNVPESDIVKVKVGQKAKLTFDALASDEVLNATIKEVEPAATVIQDVVYYRIKLSMENLDDRLKLGMSEDVDIQTASKDNVLMIPLRAVKTEGGDKIVEILKDEQNNVTEKIKITLGLQGDDGMVEVMGGALKEGDRVITLVNSPQ